MKSKLVIGFDLDGIIAAFHEAWLSWYNKTWDDNISIHQLKWDLKSIVKEECGNDVYNFIRSADIYKNILPIPGSLKTVTDLAKMGHDVLIVTHPAGGSHTIPDKMMWIRKHLPMIREDNVIFISRKELIKLDVFVDDSPRNIIPYRKAWPDSHILTIAWPYNQELGSIVNLRAASYQQPYLAWKAIQKYILDLT